MVLLELLLCLGFCLRFVGWLLVCGVLCSPLSLSSTTHLLITSPFLWDCVHSLSPVAVPGFPGSVPPQYSRDSVWTWVLVDLVVCTLESFAFFSFCKLLVFLYFVS